MKTKEKIWVRLERESTGSWLEAWYEVDKGYPREWLGQEVDSITKKDFPGWGWVNYCVPESQGPDGRPDDFDEYDGPAEFDEPNLKSLLDDIFGD